jgi:acyl-CoA reductase-like NAD-dependent aldehyde dehydrogenase
MITQPLWVAGQALSTVATASVHAPWNGDVVARVHQAGRAEVAMAMAAAWSARAVMAAAPRHERARWLRGFADAIDGHADAFTDMIVSEAGKPRRYARMEVARARLTCEAAIAALHAPIDEAMPLDQSPGGVGRYGLRRRFPVGVVVAITPFNFPLNLVMHKLAPALAAGCPIIIKPAEQTPSAALHLAALATAIGLPAGAMSVLPIDRGHDDVLADLLDDPRVALLSFTGSAAVGWRLRARMQPRRVVLELGGDAPVMVAEDVATADLEGIAARIATSACAAAGQVCIATQRILVHDNHHQAMQAALIDAFAALRCGDPHDDDTIVGPVVNDVAAARFDALVEDAQEHGATILHGGTRSGRMCMPTLMTAPSTSARLAHEEAFLPLATLAPYTSSEQLIERINASPYGLQAGVFTSSMSTLWQLHAGVRVGALVHNDVPSFRVDHMPYGGLKSSGDGFEGLPDALLHYTEPRLLVLNRT